MSSCPPEDALILLASGEPDDDVAGHVAGCETCRARVEQIREVEQALRADDLDEPDDAFFDALAADVMGALDEPERTAEIVELSPSPAADERRSRGWTLGLAAAAVILLGVALALAAQRRAQEPDAVPVAEDIPAPGLPDEATARALAEELGISLDPIDPAAVAEAEAADMDMPLRSGGLDALVVNLQDNETEALDLGLGDDVFAALAELDVDELAAVLETLES